MKYGNMTGEKRWVGYTLLVSRSKGDILYPVSGIFNFRKVYD